MVNTARTAQVTLPGDRAVSVVREFQAPRGLVYEAYTTPELMRRWLLGLPGWTMPVCEMELRVGGRYRWRWRSDEDGIEFGFHGEFLEVAPPSRLSHTQTFDPGDTAEDMGDEPTVVTVVFEERAGVTTVTTRIEYASRADRDTALATGMTDGMEMNYKLLDALLAGR